MDDRFYYKGKRKLNRTLYFDKNGDLVEEFDTNDGRHYLLRYKQEHWPKELWRIALEQGIIGH